MSRGNQRFILAIGFGLVALWSAFAGGYAVLLLTGDQQQHERHGDGGRSSDRSLSESADPNLSKSVCSKAKTPDTAALCVQWRAVLAAEDAADAAWQAIAWSIAGTLVSTAGLGALLVTIRQGRQGLEVAQTIGQAQTRAYVSIASLEGKQDEGGLVFRAKVQNSGQSPALSAQIKLEIVDIGGGIIEIMPEHEHHLPAQSASEMAFCYYRNKSAKSWEGIVVLTAVAYADVFGTLNKIRDVFAGSPVDWGGDFTELSKGMHVASYLRAIEGEDADFEIKE